MVESKNISKFSLDAKRVTEIFFHAFFILLIGISYTHYLERTIPYDGAFYSFKILFYENFNVENNRWGACYNQILPLLGIKLGASLPTVLKLYSISFAFCNYIFFLIIYYGFKQFNTAIAFILVQVVAYRYNFYYQVSEIHAIIGPIFLLFATCLSDRFMESKKWLGGLLVFIFIFWLMNIHLLSLVIIAFCIGFLFLHNRSLFRNYYLIGGILAGIIYFYFKMKAIPADSYQGQKLVSFKDMRYALFNLEHVYGYSHFKITWSENYRLPTYLGAFMVLVYCYKKMFLKLLLVVLAVFGFWVLLMGATIKVDSPIVYENYYALFGYLIVIPLVFDFLQHLRFSWFLPTFSLIITYSLIKVLACGSFMNQQIEFYKRAASNLRSFKEKKFELSDQTLDWEKVWVAWDLPFQSLLVSSIDSPDSAITFFSTNDTSLYSPEIYRDSILIVGVPWSPFWFHSNELPTKYFKVKNTLYKRMTSMQDSSFNTDYFTQDSLDINIIYPECVLYRRRSNVIPIEIKNKTNRVFSAGILSERQVYLGYRVINKKTNKLFTEGRSILDMDIFGHHTLKTALRIPQRFLDKGIYSVEVGIVEENKRWIYSGKWFTLVML